jgi:hypothetical protein
MCIVTGKAWGYKYLESSMEESHSMQISLVHPDGNDIPRKFNSRKMTDYMMTGYISPTDKRLDLLAKTSCIRDNLTMEHGFQKTDRSLEAIFKNLHVTDKEKLGFFKVYIQVMVKELIH